jgi:hypothetical protein
LYPHRALLPSTVVTDYVQLDPRDAGVIANYLFCLANLIDPDMKSRHQLTEVQRRMLTNPPAHAITANPQEMVGRLRDFVAAIHEQLGDEEPQL